MLRSYLFIIYMTLLTFAAGCQAKTVSEPVTIWSDGTRLAGDLWKPADLQPGDKVPGILLVHGWGGTKARLNQAYAPYFAELGFVVLTFDYRGWGESDGKFVRVYNDTANEKKSAGDIEVREIRQIVDPLEELNDIRCALAYLKGEPQVDAKNLAIWGSSFGGGLALHTASEFPEIKVLITQIGNVNPLEDWGNNPTFPAVTDAQVERWAIQRARGELPPFPGKEVSDTARGAAKQLKGVANFTHWKRYDPMAGLGRLQAATLIIDAKDEEYFDIRRQGQYLYERIHSRVPSAYHVLPGSHYDLYKGEGYRQALALQRAWLQKHLKPKTP